MHTVGTPLSKTELTGAIGVHNFVLCLALTISIIIDSSISRYTQVTEVRIILHTHYTSDRVAREVADAIIGP